MTIEHVRELIKRLEVQEKIAADMLARLPPQPTMVTYRGSLLEADTDLFERWIEATSICLRDGLGQHEATKFRNEVSTRRSGMNQLNEARCDRGVKFLSALIKTCKELPGQLTYTEPAISRIAPPRANIKSKKEPLRRPEVVFIIHGHDEAKRRELKEILKDRFGLTPIIMLEHAGQSRTFINKFEELAEKCDAAVAILTPDDILEDGGTGQPRPNVMLELGWFMGRRGRDRVLLIVKEGTDLPSDLLGVEQIRFTTHIEEKIAQIEKEIEAWQK